MRSSQQALPRQRRRRFGLSPPSTQELYGSATTGRLLVKVSAWMAPQPCHGRWLQGPHAWMTSPTVPSCTKERRSCLSSAIIAHSSLGHASAGWRHCHVLSASFLVRLGHGRSEATSAAVPELLRDRSSWRCCRQLLGCLRRKGHGSTVSSDADATTIQKAQEQAAILRSRIVRALGYSGWFFLLLFVIPSINVVFASDIAPGSVATVIGPWCVYWMGMPPSILMIVLTVQPTDAVGVRRACRFFFGFSCFMFTASSFVAVRNLFLSDDMALNVVNFLVWCPKTDFFRSLT